MSSTDEAKLDIQKSKGDISLVPDEVSKRKENRAKRKLSQMSKILVSAYEDRKVEVEDEVTALEKNIPSYLFAGIGDEWTIYTHQCRPSMGSPAES
ncbi:hypothetical protein QVD17_41653 [Tagetes erecta]|uniref:Uncharacterized protein n=1 Tax=Tagetes erecta TaxID=13708 RepID=A0AAD8JL00_TARER|nr:hypothetical protein QVD17_41653 [Tagetes erecta]